MPTPGRGGWRLGAWPLFVGMGLAYLVGALLSWRIFGAGHYPAFFPPAGLTVGAMLVTPRRLWPGVIATIVVVEGVVDVFHGVGAATAAGYVLANAAEPVVGASVVLAWCGRSPDLRRRVDLAKFVAGAVVAGPLVGAVIGGMTVATAVGGSWHVEAMRWWAGDAVGVLAVAPPILLWSSQWPLLRSRWAETTVVMVAAAALQGTAFWYKVPPSMTILPILMWAAVRLGVLGAALTGAVMAVAVNVMIAGGKVLFPALEFSGADPVPITQVYLGFMILVATVIAQEVHTRLHAVSQGLSERRQRVRVETLAGLAQQLSADLTPGDIGQTVAATVMNNVGAQALTLGLVNHAGDRLQWVTMAGYPPEAIAEFAGGLALSEPSAATEVIRTGQPAVLRDITDYRTRFPITARWITALGGSSFVAWPLTSGGRTVGLLNLLWREPQILDDAQVAYVSAVASMVGQALVRAQLYADESARATVLQAAVLPTEPPRVPGADIAVSYQPADATHGLGGDWFDVLPLPKGSYLAVGDVLGHGLSSVEDMAQLRTAGRTLALQGLSPSRILAELNTFTRTVTNGKFATMVIAILDPFTSTLTYAHAGHPPALLRRHHTGEVIELDDARGAALGISADLTYTEQRIAIGAGDILILYTDGLVEAPNRFIDTGISHARALIAEWNDPEALQQACQRLSDTLAPTPRRDDVCILAAQFR